MAGEKIKFGPPLRTRIPSAVYLLASIVFGIVAICAYNAPTGSQLFVWAVEGDRIRPLSVSVIAVILLVSSLATVLRTHMRGVIVTDDWVEARYLPRARHPPGQALGVGPGDARRRRRATRAGFELYDGSFERLPEVADGKAWCSSSCTTRSVCGIDVSVLERIPTRR